MEIINKIITDKIMNNLPLFDACRAFGRAAKEKNDFVGNDFVTSLRSVAVVPTAQLAISVVKILWLRLCRARFFRISEFGFNQ